jgi:uncharacterized damage-inducible protein DinB
MKDALLPEYDHEMGTARRMLERVPDNRLDWQPHDKSMTLGRLATHLAELPGWTRAVLESSEFDMAGEYTPGVKTTRQEILALFDESVAAARALIAARSDGELMAPWTLKKSGHELFTLPKMAVLRGMLLNHLIHHRGQLSVYLRLNDIAVPAIYGPSADEGL